MHLIEKIIAKIPTVFSGQPDRKALPKRVDTARDLLWVDAFIHSVKPYIFVRLEDNLLIKRPNQVQKLNSTGARVLKTLLDGTSIQALLNLIGRDAQKQKAVSDFLHAVRQSLEGQLDEFSPNPAVEIVPFEMNFSQYPVLSEIAVTYRCNLKCSFCYAGCGCTAGPAQGHAELSLADVRKILEKLFHEARVPSVSFTGGEPTLKKGLPALIRYAKDLGMRVNLITNGTRIDRQMAATLAAHGLDSAQVSVEGICAATHDRMVGVRGAFEQSVAAVGHLKDAGIFTHTNTTLTRDNLAECTAFPRFAKHTLRNERFSMNLIIPSGSGAVNRRLIVPYTEAGALIERMIAASRRESIEFMWYSPVPLCMFNSILHGLGNKGCSACDGLISIAPNGDVLPCASYDDPVGNLLADDFAAVWQSDKAKFYRQKQFAHAFCKACDRFQICNGGCPLYWQEVGYGELMRRQENPA